MRNCDDKFGIINVLGKPMPFPAKLKTFVTDDYEKIKGVLAKSTTQSIVIDDAGYLMTNQFMRGHSQAGQGNAIFAFYNTLGDSFWNLIQFIVHNTPNDKLVYCMMHEDKNDFGDVKPKTIGKMLDEKVCIEGMFTIVLRSKCENGEYYFATRTDGLDVTKTPIGLFDAPKIENDLKLVDDTLRKYYSIKPGRTEKENADA